MRLDGARPDEVERRAAEIAAPAPGTVRVHNEGETGQAISPTLQAQDAGAGARLFRNHALSGLWLARTLVRRRRRREPRHGGGNWGIRPSRRCWRGGANGRRSSKKWERSWSAAASTPAGRGVAPLPPPLAPRVEWPELVRGDESRHAAALARTVAAAAEARDRGLLGELTALRLVRAAAERLGVTFDPAAELSPPRRQGAQPSPKARRSAAPAASTAARASSENPGAWKKA